jgi:undecaprenyl phosphate N,N'-diacetylbacillosamine 1-phosphate transferase
VYKNFVKPFFDFTIACVVIVVASPVLLICILLLGLVNNGNVWFRQPRPGLDGRIFIILKFKTMTDATDDHGNLLPDEKRLTAFGKFIRKTSLDELPQLINVLKGDMSLVGPRPLLPEYLSLYDETQRRRHQVKPGITGWAQVNGRNAISWQQKFAHDIWYVDHQSFKLDIKILFLTVAKVFTAEGIGAGNNATIPKFKGNSSGKM